MSLTQLQIINLRNLTAVDIQVAPKFNLFYGQNGSGKTSLLEAIHYLGLARSFRTHLAQRIINVEAESFSVVGRIVREGSIIPAGIERPSQGQTQIRVQGKDAGALELAKILPLQLINSEMHRLLLGGPKYRRQFLDWGVFHVEPSFFPLWQRAFRALKQRNAALRSQAPKNQITSWDPEFALVANELDNMRQNYFLQFEPLFHSISQALLPSVEIKLRYQRGWPVDNLVEILAQSLDRDLQLGYTQYGPQRSDLLLRINNTPAQDALSQGQQKLLVYTLRLAQGILLRQQTQKDCIYLVDDLPAELDTIGQQRVAQILIDLNTQVFITGIEKKSLQGLFDLAESQMFHVEHGVVSRDSKLDF